MSVNLVLIGPPGCGKGTQALRLKKWFAITHISTGDILRQAVRDETPLGREVGATIARGALVGDTLMTDLVRVRLAQPDVASGFLLDGFPRTVAQALALDQIMGGTALVVGLIVVDHEAIVRRLSSRRVCESCRITQSVSDSEGERAESCPYCGGTLVRREDDDAEIVRHRLATYASSAGPVIDFYRQRPGFFSIDGLQQPEVVTRSLVAAINQRVTG
jgi:adenylate kinase